MNIIVANVLMKKFKGGFFMSCSGCKYHGEEEGCKFLCEKYDTWYNYNSKDEDSDCYEE